LPDLSTRVRGSSVRLAGTSCELTPLHPTSAPRLSFSLAGTLRKRLLVVTMSAELETPFSMRGHHLLVPGFICFFFDTSLPGWPLLTRCFFFNACFLENPLFSPARIRAGPRAFHSCPRCVGYFLFRNQFFSEPTESLSAPPAFHLDVALRRTSDSPPPILSPLPFSSWTRLSRHPQCTPLFFPNGVCFL